MKTLLTFLLLSASCYSQQAAVSFFYGTEKTLGAELLVNISDSFYLGGGFGGALKPDRTKDNEKWCDIYAVTSFGYIGNVMIKEKAGLSTFTSDNGKTVSYKPLIGIGAMYDVTKDLGIEIGADTFNKLTIGFCVIF